jgi:MoaA/NifB/PqqE/SkfB family radical SAM enzyme
MFLGMSNFFKTVYKKTTPKYIKNLLWHYKKLKPRKLLRLEIHLTDHCNLNCKGCSHFSPLAEKVFLDITAFERDCEKISGLTNRTIEELRLMGGEPLLHSKMNEIIRISRKYFQQGKITIITNGILLLRKNNDFWNTCKENNIDIEISHYPINLNIKNIRKIATEKDVILTVTDEIKKMGNLQLDIYGNQNAKNNFTLCDQSNNCIALVDGKLYTCPTVAYIKYFNKYFNQKLETTENDYIDIYKVKNIKEIVKRLCRPIPFCKYCNMQGMFHNLDWSISERKISEWAKNN